MVLVDPGVLGKPIDMRSHGTAGSRWKPRKADLEANWQRWLRWAGLKEIALDGS